MVTIFSSYFGAGDCNSKNEEPLYGGKDGNDRNFMIVAMYATGRQDGGRAVC